MRSTVATFGRHVFLAPGPGDLRTSLARCFERCDDGLVKQRAVAACGCETAALDRGHARVHFQTPAIVSQAAPGSDYMDRSLRTMHPSSSLQCDVLKHKSYNAVNVPEHPGSSPSTRNAVIQAWGLARSGSGRAPAATGRSSGPRDGSPASRGCARRAAQPARGAPRSQCWRPVHPDPDQKGDVDRYAVYIYDSASPRANIRTQERSIGSWRGETTSSH